MELFHIALGFCIYLQSNFHMISYFILLCIWTFVYLSNLCFVCLLLHFNWSHSDIFICSKSLLFANFRQTILCSFLSLSLSLSLYFSHTRRLKKFDWVCMEYIDRVWFKTPPNTSSETTLHLYFTKIESESLFECYHIFSNNFIKTLKYKRHSSPSLYFWLFIWG